MPKLLLLGLAPLLAGCAGMNEAECRAADWYRLGERDALVYAIHPQIEQYAQQCGRHGVRAEAPRYMAGWRDGYSEFSGRGGSGGMGGGM